MTSQDRVQQVAAHPDWTNAKLAQFLGVSTRTITKDRASIAPVEAPAVSDDTITNLRQQQQQLQASLQHMSVGSEVYRKTVKSISELELSIAKLAPVIPADVEYDFVTYSSSGAIVTGDVAKGPADVQARVKRIQEITGGAPRTELETGLDELAEFCGSIYTRSCASPGTIPDDIAEDANAMWHLALRLGGLEFADNSDSDAEE